MHSLYKTEKHKNINNFISIITVDIIFLLINIIFLIKN